MRSEIATLPLAIIGLPPTGRMGSTVRVYLTPLHPFVLQTAKYAAFDLKGCWKRRKMVWSRKPGIRFKNVWHLGQIKLGIKSKKVKNKNIKRSPIKVDYPNEIVLLKIKNTVSTRTFYYATQFFITRRLTQSTFLCIVLDGAYWKVGKSGGGE